MSISAAYATAVEYRAATDKTDPGQDAEITFDLLAISRYIDGEMRRFFSADATPVIRIYVPKESTTILSVNDMAATPTQIRVDANNNGQFQRTLAASDYELLPRNTDKLPEPWPFTQVVLTPWSTVSAFTAGQRIEITARYGWPAVPEAIKRATIHLTAILRLETPRATKRITEGLGDTVETSPQAQGIIRKLTEQYKVWLI